MASEYALCHFRNVTAKPNTKVFAVVDIFYENRRSMKNVYRKLRGIPEESFNDFLGKSDWTNKNQKNMKYSQSCYSQENI